MAAMMRTLWSWSPLSKKSAARDQVKADAPPADRIAATISSAESTLVGVQRIVVWENPVNSMMALLAVNAAGWVIYAFHLRVVFVAAFMALVHLVRIEWRERIWPEIRVPPPVAEDPEPWTDVSESVLSAPELIQYVQRLRTAIASLVRGLSEMRASTPFMFFLVMNSVFTVLYVLSRCVSGVVLAHLLVSLAVTVPGALLRLVPDSAWCRLQEMVTAGRQSVANSGLIQDEDCERDFLPEASPETQAYLDVMADIINGREPSPDCHEVAAFSSGLAAAPGYDEESDDDLLAPSLEHSAELEFAARPSAAEDGAAAAGLRVLSSAAAAFSAASRAAGDLVTAARPTQPPAADDDSDSDFELIGEEEALAAAQR